MEGTKCMTVTRDSAIACRISRGSFSAPGASSATFAPSIAHQNNSHTDTSNEIGVFCRITSSAPIGYSRCIHASRLITERCSTTTPLGRPVDPEV